MLPLLMLAKPPSAAALAFAAVPFAAMCLSVPLWDRVEPTVLGLPFNLAWLIVWTPLTSLCLWAAYRAEAAHDRRRENR